MIDTKQTTALFAATMLVLSVAVGGALVAGTVAADQDKEEVAGVTVDYEGCGNAFLAFNSTDEFQEVTVEYYDDQTEVTTQTTISSEDIDEEDLDTVPEQFDAEYVFRLADALADSGHSVTVVSVTIDGETFENPNDCLPAEPDQGDGDEQDDDQQDESGQDGDDSAEGDDGDEETGSGEDGDC